MDENGREERRGLGSWGMNLFICYLLMSSGKSGLRDGVYRLNLGGMCYMVVLSSRPTFDLISQSHHNEPTVLPISTLFRSPT